jgi:mannan endo-1,4-beta-mannosidase
MRSAIGRLLLVLTLLPLGASCGGGASATTGTSTRTASASGSGSAVSPSDLTTTASLLAYIGGLSGQSKHILSGQHTNYWDSNPMDIVTPIRTATGSQVAILGTTNDWNGTSNEDVVSLSNAWLAQGGIVLVSQSPQNPLKSVTGTYADVHTPGTAAYAQWRTYLDTQIAKLKQIKGPVIWRPFIELNKDWSWWAGQNPTDFKIIWQQMHDYFAANGVNNVLWLFNVNTWDSSAGVQSWYPGDDYVDLVSLDAYPPGTKGDTPVYNALVATGKPIMYAETGVHGPDNSDTAQQTYDNGTLLATIKANFPKVFAVVIWCQNYALPLQKGESAFMSDPAIITLGDLPAVAARKPKSE